jgi:Ca2+/Na+ antiporter
MHPGTVGAIVGSVLGLLGGAAGTYFSIKNTRGPRERAFVVKASVITWVAVITFLAGLLMLPSPYRFGLWAPYVILLAYGIRAWNRAQARIREEEARGGTRPVG